MTEILSKINSATVLADTEVSAEEATVFPGSTPVLATPAAFLGGVAVSSAVVGAFEAGRG